MDLAEIEKLSTPSLILDIARVRRNAERMSAKATALGVRLRPHIKTHKCVEIARFQTAGHSGAITVSTLEEARAFAANGFSDITYAVPIEPGKFAAAFELMQHGITLNLLTDDLETVRKLAKAAANADVKPNVFIKIDCGTHRVGVEPQSAAALDLVFQISNSKFLTFAGILTHAGHSYDVPTVEDIKAVAGHERDVMVDLKRRLNNEGIDVPTVSIGSTPTMSLVDDLSGIDEIRPGNYIFFDNYQATLGSCSFEDTALTVLAAVVHASNGKLVIDAGGIAMSKDRGPVGLDPSCGYGRVLDLEGNDTGMRLTSLSQEHGVIENAENLSYKVGDRVRILANHSCMTAAQHSHYNILENGEIIDQWEIHRGW
ncbi:MAG TPA: alanine racemase [Pyrinomonadaceae bacterium]|nr:alanine racemase [Pyrinomonadaceae bacterium]